jgi:C4-dicarboxylate transporter
MRKVVVLGGLLLAAAFISSTPTQAATVGCACVKLGAPAICSATIADCNLKVGGVCLAACAYEAPKKMARRHKKKM